MQASAFVLFPDVHSACSGASVLRDQTAVDAVEMFDRAALRSISPLDPFLCSFWITCIAWSWDGTDSSSEDSKMEHKLWH